MRPRPAVALATAREVPDLDDEGALLRAELESLGVRAEPAVWDDASLDWAAYDLVVIRSTWDYPSRHRDFLTWVDHVASVTSLANPAASVRWSTDKHYLADLEAAGVPIVPSVFLDDERDPSHSFLDVEHVVKPAVSAGSKDTLRIAPGDAERSLSHVRALLEEGRTVLVQPYLHEVDTRGEAALIFLDGDFSHAATKAALLERDADPVAGLFAPETITRRDPDAEELAVAAQALDVAARQLQAAGPGHADSAPLLYARVDLLPGSDGPLLLELELVEPSLFLQHDDGATRRLAAAIAARVAGDRGIRRL